VLVLCCLQTTTRVCAVQTYTITVTRSGANCDVSVSKGGAAHDADIALTSGTGSIVEICSQGDSQHYLTCAPLAFHRSCLPCV
jgi:hypothetical protein